MTPPSTSKSKLRRSEEKKVIILMVGVVCPILIALAVLIGLGIIDFTDEKDRFRFEKTGNFPEQLLRPREILMSTNLFNLGLTLDEEIALVEEIYSRVDDLQCMNVNWYGAGGKRQIFYNDSVGDIQMVFLDLGITFELVNESTFIHFITNPVMQLHIEVNCPHVWAIDEVPNEYDQNFNENIAMTPYQSCFDHPFFHQKEYCELLPKKPLER